MLVAVLVAAQLAKNKISHTSMNRIVFASAQSLTPSTSLIQSTTMSETLFDLIQRGELDGLRQLLAATPLSAEARQAGSGLGALMFALYHKQFASAELVRAARADLDWSEACGVGDLARLELLVERDPSIVLARTSDGFTALHLCCFFRHAELAEFLLARGADVNALASNPTQLRPLHSAAAGRDLATVLAVLAAKPDVNARQIRGFVALHSSALSGDLAIADALLRAGADKSLRADDGKDALAFAREGKHTALERLLERA